MLPNILVSIIIIFVANGIIVKRFPKIQSKIKNIRENLKKKLYIPKWLRHPFFICPYELEPYEIENFLKSY